MKNREKAKIPEVISEHREKTSEIVPNEPDAIIAKVEHKNVIKDLDIETLPSTRDFIRFMSLDYSDGLNLE